LVKMKMGNVDKNSIVNQLSDIEFRWFAVYTKYKCEKYVQDHLNKKQIATYLPIIHKTKRYTRKIKHLEVPMINCYVFVHITKDQYVPTLETEYVVKFLKQGKDLIAIPQHEIELLKRVAGYVDEAKELNSDLFEEGDEVEVISGHLTGVKGRLIAKEGKKSFLIELKSIAYQFRINIDPKILKPVKQAMLIG
jgi:transcription antitermination factor NusG